MERRYADDARIVYHNTELAEVREEFAAIIEEIENRGLLYPVTVVDGVPVYDGAVSYPAIMKVVGNKLLERQPSEA
jgi:disulfide oxidoreductase YuzD